MSVPNTRYLVLKPNPNLGLSKMYQVLLALSPSVNYFWTASEGKQNEMALFMIQINVLYLIILTCSNFFSGWFQITTLL